MKNQSGITLIVLAVTIIVLTIILGVTLNYGLSGLSEARKKNYSSEVNIVAQAVAEQYIKIVELGYEKALVPSDKAISEQNPATTQETVDATDNANKPKVFVGQRIGYGMLKDTNSLKPTNKNFLLVGDQHVIDSQMYDDYDSGVLYYVKCYYRLNKNDLEVLRINAGNPNDPDASNNSLEYIVNYFTGEVLNIKKKEYYTGIRSGSKIDSNNPSNSIVSREQNVVNPTILDFNTVSTENTVEYLNVTDGVSDLYEH